jgi:hypothetical protein
VRCALLWLLLVGCGRIGFDVAGDGGGDDDDGPPDDGGGSGSGIRLRDQFGVESVQNGNTVSFTFPRAQYAGDLSLLFIAWEGNTLVDSVVDTVGTTYTQVGGILTNGTALRQEVRWASTIASPAGNMVTINFATTTTNVRARILYYMGTALPDPLDTVTQNLGSDATCDSASAIVSTQNAHLVAGCASLVPLVGPGPGFTQVYKLGLLDGLYEERSITDPGLYNATVPLTASGIWTIHIVALRPR